MTVESICKVIERHVERVRLRAQNPRVQRALQKRIALAAADVGITGVEAVVLPENSLHCLGYSNIVLRQPDFVRGWPDVHRDIGYVRGGTFYANPFAFTDERFQQFCAALDKRRVYAQQFGFFGCVTHSPIDDEMWKARDKRAFYK